MKKAGEIRWLQLPDLNTIIPEKLVMLGKILNEQFAKTTDFIVITGNLYRNDQNSEIILGFLNELAKGINKKDIIIVFGDADVKYRDDPTETEEQKRIIRNTQKRIQYNLPLDCTDTERNALLSRFVKYSNLLKKFYIKDSVHEAYENHIHVYEDAISLLCINTAYISDCNHAGKQAFDMRGFDELQNYQYPCIAVMYHDFDEIVEMQQKYLTMKLDELGVSAILCGHKLLNAPKSVTLEDDTHIPVFCCGKQELQSGNYYMECEILEYIWNVGTETVDMKLYKWNHSKSTFQHIANNKFLLRNMNTSTPDERNAAKPSPIHRTTYTCEKILIAASAVITLILLFLFQFQRNNNKLYPEYKGSTQSGSCIFEMQQQYSEFDILTVGQIIITTKDGTVIKTYIIDGMYQSIKTFYNTKKFEIAKLECPLADSCFESFDAELNLLLKQEGFDKDRLILKDIGFVAVSLPPSETDERTFDYYIFENNSLHHLDKETATAKMSGIHLTEEIWENTEAQEKILDGLRECILSELTGKTNQE